MCLTLYIFLSIIIFIDAELCKGSTADSDSVCLGSNPSSAANARFYGVIQSRVYARRDFYFV